MSVRLSVVVPVYGTAKYLRTCLDSLMNQTLHDAEFILVNDATPDDSPAIMAEYAKQDSRFRIVSHDRNRGLYAARLTGIQHASGSYIAFLDSDDYVSVDFYRAAVTHAEKGGFEVVVGDTVWVESDGQCFVRPLHRDALPNVPLYGDDVRRAFYSQEMSCYSWHTIWNKIYTRELFERCMPWLTKLDKHIIMTEDIAFSSVLLHEATSLGRIHGDGVFYCMHAASSTNAAYADQKRFFKNYGDIVDVFEFVSEFLAERNDREALDHIAKARLWYCRMWTEAREKCAGTGAARSRADALTERLSPGFQAEKYASRGEIWWYDQPVIPWNDGLEKIKRAIAGLDGYNPGTISFDVFDTLIQRPFRQPSDVFSMLEDQWQKANRRCLHSFAAARAEADASARAWTRETRADIPLTAIYDAMRLTAGASEDCTDTMCQAERETEIAFSLPRETGVRLFELAKSLGKRVILISDMYLDRETITAMLNKAGLSDWDAFFLSSEENALKWNGDLYRKALENLQIAADDILHIGDNWQNDFLSPRKLGMHSMHHPRAMDVMTDPARTALGRLGMNAVASFGGADTLQSALSFRCMQALAADRFFDNGFSPTTRDSAFACSPALLGYYAVGGHALALAQWLIASARRDGIRKLVFLARDGGLVKRMTDRILTPEDGITTVECPASRRCLLPALTAHPSDFYALPINIPAYSVVKLLTLLEFCTAEIPSAEIKRRVSEAGYAWEEPFPGKYRYIEFIRWYLENLYDGRKHQRAYNMLREYYEPIMTEGCACFDMGYSGRLQAALSQLSGRNIPVYYVHDDQKEAPRLARAYGFRAECFYPLKPGMSGAFREFLLSADEAPCVGFARSESGIEPVYGPNDYNVAAHAFVGIVHENALRFAEDYMRTFRGTPAEVLEPVVCSAPFEDALRYLPQSDLAMFAEIRFEDTVFAGRDDLDLSCLVRDQSAAANMSCGISGGDLVGFVPSRTPLIKRTIGFLLFDRGQFKEKARKRLAGHPALFNIARCMWRVLKKVRSLAGKGGG